MRHPMPVPQIGPQGADQVLIARSGRAERIGVTAAEEPDLVEFRIGPVDADVARLWLHRARAGVAVAAGDEVPPEVAAGFGALLEAWAAACRPDAPFEWSAVVERSLLRRAAT